MDNYKYTAMMPTIIDLFGSKDQQMPNLMVPQDWYDSDNKGYWCITDAHIALLIPHDDIGPALSDGLDYTSIMSGLNKLDDPFLFTLNEFKYALAKFDSRPGFDEVYRTCDKCEGEGEITCDKCNHAHDCETCETTGEILVSREPNGRLHYKNNDPYGGEQIIKIGSGLFNPNFISKIGNAIKLLNLKDSIIQVTHNDPKKATIFLVGEVMFLTMPKLPNDSDKIMAILPIPNY